MATTKGTQIIHQQSKISLIHFQIPTMNNMVGLGNRDVSRMSHMCAFSGSHVGLDEGFGDILDNSTCAAQDNGLEM